jgi:hypothetical protein
VVAAFLRTGRKGDDAVRICAASASRPTPEDPGTWEEAMKFLTDEQLRELQLASSEALRYGYVTKSA